MPLTKYSNVIDFQFAGTQDPNAPDWPYEPISGFMELNHIDVTVTDLVGDGEVPWYHCQRIDIEVSDTADFAVLSQIIECNPHELDPLDDSNFTVRVGLGLAPRHVWIRARASMADN